jgi:sporulation protein YlmC with PRC-barrel domain
MKTLVAVCAGILLASSTAFASELLTSVPNSSRTVTDWYKQNVYDPNNNKIGEIMDVLVEPSGGQINAAIVGVGGFLGAGEKDVAVNFSSIKSSVKDNKVHLTMDTTKDELKKAPGFKYDRDKNSWVPDNSTK